MPQIYLHDIRVLTCNQYFKSIFFKNIISIILIVHLPYSTSENVKKNNHLFEVQKKKKKRVAWNENSAQWRSGSGAREENLKINLFYTKKLLFNFISNTKKQAQGIEEKDVGNYWIDKTPSTCVAILQQTSKRRSMSFSRHVKSKQRIPSKATQK